MTGANGNTDAFVHGTLMAEAPIHEDGSYAVFVGRVVSPDKPDMDHYLVVNKDTRVIEASANRLIDARAACWGLNQAKLAQDAKIDNGNALIEEEDNDDKRSWN